MSFFIELAQVIGLGVALLLPLANPLTTMAVMLGLAKDMTKEEMRHEAMMTSVYSFIIMCGAFYVGQFVMNSFGISIPGLRIAGGLIVAFIGFRMLFPAERVANPVISATEKDMEKYEKQRIAFVPLAMPTTAGPGTIAMIISSTASVISQTKFSPLVIQIAPVCIFLTMVLILWVCLRSADTIIRWIGKSGVETFSRLMGFLLVCMGVQFIINGILELIRTHV